MGEPGFNPNNYLRQHLEPKADQEMPEAREEGEGSERPFLSELVRDETVDGERIQEYREGSRGFKLVTEPLDEALEKYLLASLDEFALSARSRKWLAQFLSSGGSFVKELSLSKEGGEDFVLRSAFAHGSPTALISPDFLKSDAPGSEEPRSDGLALGDLVFLGRELSSLEGLAVLLHEWGHSVVGSPGEGRKSLNTGRLITKELAAEVLKSERDAWAFAVRKLRPFLNEQNRQDVLAMVHASLATYSRELEGRMPPQWFPGWAESLLAYLEKVLEKPDSEDK